MLSNNHLMFVIYDGIENSVFQSQVLQPLLHKLENECNLHITLVSYEKSSFSYSNIASYIPAHDRLDIIINKKIPFFGKASLINAARIMQKLICSLQPTSCIARGPLAGYIVLKAFTWQLMHTYNINKPIPLETLPPITIQARGLAAEEYRYTKQHVKKGPLNAIFAWSIYTMLKHVETLVYGNKLTYAAIKPVTIEAVSRALKLYLEETFNTQSNLITIAHNDIPPLLTNDEKSTYRARIRKELQIPESVPVYCYSGSYKPWQCPQETIEHFKNSMQQQPHAILCIYTNNLEDFRKILHTYAISQQSYRLLTVPNNELLHYLAACDFGYLFREKDIINWVARPTKALEYKAAGLTIIHNNTVAMLENYDA